MKQGSLIERISCSTTLAGIFILYLILAPFIVAIPVIFVAVLLIAFDGNEFLRLWGGHVVAFVAGLSAIWLAIYIANARSKHMKRFFYNRAVNKYIVGVPGLVIQYSPETNVVTIEEDGHSPVHVCRSKFKVSIKDEIKSEFVFRHPGFTSGIVIGNMLTVTEIPSFDWYKTMQTATIEVSAKLGNCETCSGYGDRGLTEMESFGNDYFKSSLTSNKVEGREIHYFSLYAERLIGFAIDTDKLSDEWVARCAVKPQ